MLSQERAPIYEALQEFEKKRVVPFDVPGHKRGRGNPELASLLGEKCVRMDVNSMKPLDNLCHPVSVIREAEELAAEAFGAAHAFLMVGGLPRGTGNDPFLCEKRRQDHSTEKCTPQCYGGDGPLRSYPRLCRPGFR